jgi:exosortase C (VPDSG-CTERM-specific)
MNQLETQTSRMSPGAQDVNPSRSPKVPLTRFALCALVLSLAFCRPLYSLIRLALAQELYSHIILIPLVSVYLVWIRKTTFLRAIGSKTSSGLAISLLVAALASLGLHWILMGRGEGTIGADALVLPILSFVLFLASGALFFFGQQAARLIAFPLAFLIFLVPFPHTVENAIEVFFQHTSAEAANLMLSVSDTPFLRDGLYFKMPGITIRVAEECSGIRSSLVLFITSLLAGYMFLRTPWKKAVLTFVVIPLAILRNGFRIATIAMLCAHLDSSWIDSPLHHRGGPIFFALSLVPFFGMLIWLRKSEAKKVRRESTAAASLN